MSKGDPWGKLLRYSVSPRYAGYDSGVEKIDLTTTGMETKTIKTSSAADPATLENLATTIPAVVFSQGARNQGVGVAFYLNKLQGQDLHRRFVCEGKELNSAYWLIAH